MATPPAHLGTSALPRCAAAAAAGLLFGVVCALSALATVPGNAVGDAARDLHALVPHVGSALSRVVGGWWGWGAAPTLAALVMARSSLGRSRLGLGGFRPVFLRASLAAWTFLVAAVLTYYLTDPLAGVALDTTSLGLWLAGSVVVAPAMGLIGTLGASPSHLGALVRVAIPLSSIIEVLALPPSVSTRDTAWSELLGCLVLIAIAVFWAILAFARASHEVERASVTAWESQPPRPVTSGGSTRSGGGPWDSSTASPRPSASSRSVAA